MNNHRLTSPASSLYSEGAITNRAVSGLRRDAERSVFVLGHFSKPECLHVVRHGAALLGCRNTRAFFIAQNAKTNRRCFMAQDDHPVDVLEPAKCKIAFLADMFVNQDSDEFQFSIAGAAGLYFILRDIEDEIIEAQRLMDNYKEVK